MFSEMTGNSDLGLWKESICPFNGCQLNNTPPPAEKITETVSRLLRNSEALPSFGSYLQTNSIDSDK